MAIDPHIESALAMPLLAMAFGTTAVAQTSTAPPVFGSHPVVANDQAAIRDMMASYNAALNKGDTAAVLPLYTKDGVFMPPYSRSAVGQDAVRKAYDDVFKELMFNVKFDIAELVQMAPTWAYVRTDSAGSTAHASTGRTTSEANQELFILQKGDDGMWRIARYSFSPTNPPVGA
jgi:uncharacterized protein (TIGR02246 family)